MSSMPATISGPRQRRGMPLGAIRIFGALLISIAAGALIGSGLWIAVAILLAAAVALAAGLVAPAGFLAGFLVLRPLLDRFAETEASLGGAGINAAAGFALLLLVLFAVLAARDESVTWPKPAGAFAVVLGVSAVGAVLAYVEVGSEVGVKPVAELVRLAALLGVFLIAASYATGSATVRRIFLVGGLTAVIPALVGLQQMLGGNIALSAELTIARIQGTFTGPNPYGMYLALAALILIALPREDLRPLPRVVALMPILAALVGTYSRTGWAMFLLGFAVLMWPRHKPALLGAGAMIVVLVIAVPDVRERIIPRSDTAVPGASASVDTSSYAWRLDTWSIALGKYVESPLLGFGLATAEEVNPRQGIAAGTLEQFGYSIHNMVIRILVEGGIALLAAYVAFAIVLYRSLLHVLRSRPTLAPYARILLVLWLLIAVIGVLADDPLLATAMMYLMFALTGTVLGTALRADSADGTEAAT